MPLIDPTQEPKKDKVQEILRQAGILRSKAEDEDIDSIFDDAGLSKVNIVKNLAEIAFNGESDAIKLQATKASMEARKMLKPEGLSNQTSFTVVIKDSQAVEINPILIPR